MLFSSFLHFVDYWTNSQCLSLSLSCSHIWTYLFDTWLPIGNFITLLPLLWPYTKAWDSLFQICFRFFLIQTLQEMFVLSLIRPMGNSICLSTQVTTRLYFNLNASHIRFLPLSFLSSFLFLSFFLPFFPNIHSHLSFQ